MFVNNTDRTLISHNMDIMSINKYNVCNICKEPLEQLNLLITETRFTGTEK